MKYEKLPLDRLSSLIIKYNMLVSEYEAHQERMEGCKYRIANPATNYGHVNGMPINKRRESMDYALRLDKDTLHRLEKDIPAMEVSLGILLDRINTIKQERRTISVSSGLSNGGHSAPRPNRAGPPPPPPPSRS